ncbi:MAG TPA: uracil-DNA glycosylase family protein [Acidobacteriaceae bacterium]|nr:uracil-DNA glycosylase family protein [Acidobacteriaceae bacterium]
MSLSPEQQLRAYVEYFRDLGVYELYRQAAPEVAIPERWRELMARPKPPATPQAGAAVRPATAAPAGQRPTAAAQSAPGPMRPTGPQVPAPRPAAQAHIPQARIEPEPQRSYFETALPEELQAPMPKPVSFDALAPLPAEIVSAGQRVAALEAVRAEIGDCTRCPLAYAGRHKIVFADGDPNATLMFVGEGPGADEDTQGLPFVGKAGQLLNNMIGAMGLKREEVYIANIVKCRPPGNRTPEFAEASTCSQFLLKQIDIVRPKVIVALGATAATYLLGVRQSLTSLRGRWHSTRGAKLVVTYHPAFLLRDPRQKGEAWKDLQMVMAELGLKAPAKK